MAKLILEEGGERRAFRFKEGKLTIGSGEGCTLTLESSGVEALHATLLLKGGRAVLTTEPGAAAPRMNGRAVAERVELPASCSFSIGGAKFEFSAEETAAPAPAASEAKRPAVRKQAASSAKPAAKSGSRPAVRKPAARTPVADRGARPERVTASRREVKPGMPTWALLLLLLGGAVGVVFGVKAFFDSSNVATVDPGVQLLEATNAINAAQLLAGASHLDKFDTIKDKATDAQRAKARELREVLATLEKKSLREGTLLNATKELDARLRKYVDKQMAGDRASRPRARVFVMRCREFRKKYPDHPDIDWVDRYEAQFSGLAQMSDPSTLEDLQWEVNTYTWTNPRDYKAVFAAIDKFLEHADPGERDAALALRDEHLAARVLHHNDRMLQMRYHWEKGETGEAMLLFVYHLTMWGDEAMEDEVAKEMTQIGDFPNWLRIYKQQKPDEFAEIVKNRYVREVAQREGLL